MPQWIYGKNVVLEALRTKRVRKVLLLNSFHESLIEQIISQQRLPVERVGKERFDNYGDHHQGIAAEVNDFIYADLNHEVAQLRTKPQSLILMLDSITDPQNLGAIIRNAEAFGVDALIIKKDQQVQVNATVTKVAAGALEHMKVIQVANLSQTILKLKEEGFWIVGTDLNTAQDYRDFNYQGPIALVIGSEGDGLHRLVKERCDVLVHIPMMGQVNSLNAASATAVVLAWVHHARFPFKKK
jgi:23S rRNA (guanosine2251-2'-O)-methyltransferase